MSSTMQRYSLRGLAPWVVAITCAVLAVTLRPSLSVHVVKPVDLAALMAVLHQRTAGAGQTA